jgi:type VI secretion system ImpC/EvpB family protein/type VI secretion system ImpB/VipA family protein
MSMSYDLKFGKQPGERRREPSDTIRVLVLGDFLGETAALEPRRAVKVNITDLDGLLAKLRPSLTLETAGSRSLDFRSLDDFHPDAVLKKLPALADLVNLRQRLDHPTTSVAAAAELRGAAVAAQSRAIAAPAQGDSLLENLLGGSPKERSGGAPQTALEATGIDGLIRSLVAPHLSAGRDPAADELVRVTDAVITASLRGVLHHVRFQALEAAYRGLSFLTSRSESGSVDYFVLPVTPAELESEARAESNEFLSTVLDSGGRGFSLVIALHEFGAAESDLSLLTNLSQKVQEAGALFLAGASPAIAGAADAASLPKLRPGGPTNAAWTAFREESGGPHVGLALPRFLLRSPYGKRTDPIESFAFEELEGLPNHAAFLWGNSAWIAAFALLVAASSGDSPGGLDVDELPSVVVKHDGESHLVPCAEVLLNEQSIETLIGAGLMPVVSDASRAAVRFVRAQSIALPPTPLALATAE